MHRPQHADRRQRPPPNRGPRVILHAGSHKTGTTGLQYVLSENRAHLRALGVWYPRHAGYFDLNPNLASARSHLAFAAAVAGFSSRDRRRIGRFLRRIHSHAARFDRIVLSAESLYRLTAEAPPDGPGETALAQRIRFLDRLAALLCGYETEVLLYLRRADRFAASLYAELIASTNMRVPFDRFLTEKAQNFDYRRQIDLFRAYFPVQVQSFEAAVTSGLVETFCAHAGIPGHLPETPAPDRPSLADAAVLWLLREKQARWMSKIERRRRWHFALLPDHAGLFDTPGRAGFWPDRAARDAFVEASQSDVAEVRFPELSGAFAPRVSWSDARHADAERRFAAWQAGNAGRLEDRERNKVPPYILGA